MTRCATLPAQGHALPTTLPAQAAALPHPPASSSSSLSAEAPSWRPSTAQPSEDSAPAAATSSAPSRASSLPLGEPSGLELSGLELAGLHDGGDDSDDDGVIASAQRSDAHAVPLMDSTPMLPPPSPASHRHNAGRVSPIAPPARRGMGNKSKPLPAAPFVPWPPGVALAQQADSEGPASGAASPARGAASPGSSYKRQASSGLRDLVAPPRK